MMARVRKVASQVVFAAAVFLRASPCQSSPNHDDLQMREIVQTSWQHYTPLPLDDKMAGRRLDSLDECEQVARKPWETMRIGFEFLDVEGVTQEVQNHVEHQILTRAIDFWSSALRVHRVSQPLRAEYMGERCEKYGLAFNGHVITAEQHYTCETARPPLCGPHGLTIPAKFLKGKRVCSKNCPNVVETFSHLLEADRVCDNCTDLPEGPGADGYDFFVLVTLKDDYCDGDVQAHATTCVKDQCDRPIFGLINFCREKISMKAEDTDRQVTTAVHELAHALAFSAHHFQYFRHPDGKPKLPREVSNPSILQNSVPWSCSYSDGKTRYVFPDADGDRRYVDLSDSGIVGKFNERGLDRCPCPVGHKDMLPNCILPPQPSFRAPSCIFELTTPMVVKKAQEFFGCDRLHGAELENQPTSPCVIVSSHWEQRAFMGEVMVSAQVIQPTFLSEVTLALFHDSGWYLPNYSMSDPLVKGVHWGYKQGCDFATKPCVQGGKTDYPRFWCTTSGARACSLDRLGEVQCSAESAPPGEVLPLALRYTQPALLGSVAEADYCPFYHVQITNHGCTDASATTFPISNVNFERETFGAKSRCLDSTLNGNVKAENDGVYRAEADRFSTPKPRCYEIHCLSLSYEVWISDLRGGKIKLGICTSAEQTLTGLGLQGQVTCAAPEELCGLKRATHLGPPSNSLTTITPQLASKAEAIPPIAVEVAAQTLPKFMGISGIDAAGSIGIALLAVTAAILAGVAVTARFRLAEERICETKQGWVPVPQGGTC